MASRELSGTYQSSDIPRWSFRRYHSRIYLRRGIYRTHRNILFCSLIASFIWLVIANSIVILIAFWAIVFVSYRKPISKYGGYFCNVSVWIASIAFLAKRLSASVADDVVVYHFFNHFLPPSTLLSEYPRTTRRFLQKL